MAFVGAVSNIHSLCIKYHWLAWVCDLPDVVVGIISGILPPVLLAVLFMLLPIVLRLLARLEGIPKRTGLELSLMDRFFIFEVIVSATLSHGSYLVLLYSFFDVVERFLDSDALIRYHCSPPSACG